jgi:hypothetical protein
MHNQYIPDSDADSSVSSLAATPTGSRTPRPGVSEALPDVELYITAHTRSSLFAQDRLPGQRATPVPTDVEAASDADPSASIYVHVDADREDRARCWVIFERAMRSLGIQEKAHDHDVAIEVLRRIGDVVGGEIETERIVVEDALNDRKESLAKTRAAETELQLAMEMIDEIPMGEVAASSRLEFENTVLRLRTELDDLTRKYEEFEKLYRDRKKELRMMILLHEYLTHKYPNPSPTTALF